MIRIRRATYPDLDRLMQIFDEARYTISLLGIDQWQDGYPSRSVISEDIAAGTSYCVENEGNICGTFMLLSAKEPTYDFIEGGSWLTDDRERGYLAIHRVAIAVDQRGQGISTRIIEFASEYAKKIEPSFPSHRHPPGKPCDAEDVREARLSGMWHHLPGKRSKTGCI